MNYLSFPQSFCLEAPSNQTPAPSSTFRSVSELITNFDKCWDGKQFTEIEFDKERFLKLVKAHTDQFKPIYNTSKDYGFIEKKDLLPGSQIFVRADLHGDLKSLIENLKTCKEQGLLDENFRCRPDVQLVFLGDYEDRGSNSAQVLEVLMTLKMENPEQVTLIRGNHENAYLNMQLNNHLSDPHFYSILRTETGSMDINGYVLMEELYQTMSLTIFMSEQSNEREYVVFTHGMFELYVDPTEMLNSDAPRVQMVVSQKREFSSRVQLLISQVRQRQNDETLPPKIERSQRKAFKQRQAAGRIDLLFQEEKRQPSEPTSYNWGDIVYPHDAKQESFFTSLELRQWKLTPSDIKHYFRLCSSQHQVKMMFRGHQHEKMNHELNGKVFVSTMPVGMDSGSYASHYKEQLDTAYILTTAPKVKDWKKFAYLREPGKPTKEIAGPCPIYSNEL